MSSTTDASPPTSTTSTPPSVPCPSRRSQEVFPTSNYLPVNDSLDVINVDENENGVKAPKITDSDDDFVNDEEPFHDPIRSRVIAEGAFRWFSMDQAIDVLESFSCEVAPPTMKVIDKILQRRWMTLPTAQRRHYEEIAAYEFDVKKSK